MDPNQNRAGAPTAVIMAFLVGVFGLIFQNDSLKSSRPQHAKVFFTDYKDLEDVDSRLWEDPLMAIKTDSENDKKKFSIFPECKNIHSLNAFNKSCGLIKYEKKTTFLGVTAQWGPYLENQEHRRRFRYAVVSGLGASDFLPNNPTHIGYIYSGSVKYLKYPEFIPFEIFDKGDEEQVILLWLDDALFRGYGDTKDSEKGPFKFKELVSDLVGDEDEFKKVHLKLLGPADSDSLKVWITAINDKNLVKCDPKETVDREINIYSPYATAPLKKLINEPAALSVSWCTPNKPKEETQEEPEEKIKINLVRTVNTDLKLVGTLKEELERRGINFKKDDCIENKFKKCDKEFQPKIVLVSEWDTVYGRGFRDYLAKEFKLSRCDVEKETFDRNKCPIITANYMRGLDGEVKKDKFDKSKDSSKDGNNKGTKDIENLNLREKANGNRQFDYLRRLAKSLKEKNKSLKDEKIEGFPAEYGADIKAIGILGTDVYDKLLVLQALKKDFPETIFFTTDLEENLLGHNEYKWARNLLVVTNFDLRLNEKLQGETPPFRDSYQTSTFLATRAAFAKESSWLGKGFSEKPDDYLKPRIYEVGRTGAIDLSENQSIEPCDIEKGYECSIHPKVNLPRLGKFFIVYLFLSVIIYWTWIFRPWSDDLKRKEFSENHKFLVRFFILVLLCFVGMHIWIYRNLNNVGEEPFFWLEGISLWPTNLIRLASIVLTWAFFLLAVKWLDECNKEIKESFNFKEESLDKVMDSKLGLKNWYRKWFLLDLQLPYKEQTILNPSDIWSSYCYYFDWKRKIIRMVLGVGGYFLALFLLFYLFYEFPNTPYRSDFSKNITSVIVFASVFSFLALLILVVDEIRLTSKFIKVLTDNNMEWDGEVYKRLRVDRRKEDRTLGAGEEEGRNKAPKGWELFFNNWIKARLIARFTKAVDNIIYFPFIIILMLIVSRFRIFDNWNMPLPLVIIFATNFLLASYFGFRLHKYAKKAKDKILKEMENEEIALFSKGPSSNKKEELRLDRKDLQVLAKNIIEKTRAIREGAFVPFWEQPILQSVMIPFSGYGGFALLEYVLIV